MNKIRKRMEPDGASGQRHVTLRVVTTLIMISNKFNCKKINIY